VLEAIKLVHSDHVQKVIWKHREVVIRAIDLISMVDKVEWLTDIGCEVNTVLMEKLHGLHLNPEDTGDPCCVEGDMCAPLV
jgi:hypothetical protein